MGLTEPTRANYLTIGDGKIKKRVKQPTEKSVTRTTKDGNTIHEEVFSSLTGFIIDIKVYTHEEYGKFWNVYVKDEKDTFCLQMNYSGGYSSSFLKTLPNVDFSQEVTISPNMKIENDKKKVTVFLKQNDQPLKWFFTKDDPKGLPPMNKVRFKGQDTWDDTDMMEFLENMVNTQIIPQLRRSSPANQPAPAKPASAAEGIASQYDDDLPF